MRRVSGTIVIGGETTPDVLFEVRGPNGGQTIVGQRTDSRGRFRFGALPPGSYDFKTTMDGYKSWSGRIEITRKAPKKTTIRLELYPGW
jgi:hypothetical protein